MDNEQKLKDMRDTVLNELTPLLVDSDMPPEDKFSLQLSAAANSGNSERFEQALETARKIEDNTTKATAYMQLLDAIDGQFASQPAKEPEQNN
jgi:hypothetical protein